MKRARQLAGLTILLLGAVFPAIASAQSAAPLGLWQGVNSGDYILVQTNGDCAVQGMVNVSGTCSWDSTSTGGVLTMTYQWTIGPANIYWSIRWIDDNTLLINDAEHFVRRG